MVRITIDDGKKTELLHATCDDCESLRAEVERLQTASGLDTLKAHDRHLRAVTSVCKALAAWEEGTA